MNRLLDRVYVAGFVVGSYAVTAGFVVAGGFLAHVGWSLA